MEFRRLKYFVAVAEQGSFRRAAETLNIAQSALSRHVREMSEAVGGPLFERTSRGVCMTFLGEQLYAEARPLLERLDGLYVRARKATGGEVGHLTIGINEIGARSPRTASSIRLCQSRYPDICLDFIALNSAQQITALEAGAIDAGIVVERPRNASGLNHLALGEDAFMLALREDHPLARRETLAAAELRSEPFVAVKLSIYEPAQRLLFAGCQAIGLEPRVFQEVPSEQMQLAFIKAGMGVGFVNESAGDNLPSGVVLRPVTDLRARLQIDLVWPDSRSSGPVQHLVSSFRELAGTASNQAHIHGEALAGRAGADDDVVSGRAHRLRPAPAPAPCRD